MTNLIRQLASFFRVPERVALIFTDRGDGTSGPVSPDNPMPVTWTTGAPGDPSSAREVTLQALLDATNQLTFAVGVLRNQAEYDGLRVQEPTVLHASPNYETIEDNEVDMPLPAVPAWANQATLRVVRGSLLYGYGDSQDTPPLGVGAVVVLRGAELSAVQCRTTAGGLTRVEYAQVGPVPSVIAT